MPENSKTVKLVKLSLMCCISIILALLFRIPIFLHAPFLIYDMSDIPILIAALLFDTISGFNILLVVAVIQSFVLSGSGVLGFIMHMLSSLILIFCMGKIYHNKKTGKSLILGAIIGIVLTVILMTPINYILISTFLGIPKEAAKILVLSAVIPFNLIKSILNGTLSIIFFKLIKKYLYRKVQSYE